MLGVLNVTPDSFSDGGRFQDPVAAVEHARRLVEEGAVLIDVGGESTRPGARPVSASEELARILPVIEALVPRIPIPISIDTSKADVAAAALDAGARLVNDVTAGLGDSRMLPVVAEREACVILMHRQGTPRTMQSDPRYDDVVREVGEHLVARVAAAEAAGVARDRIAIDPGIGFGKTLEHNLALLAGLDSLVRLGLPVVVGVSRKSFLGALLDGAAVGDRLEGSLAAAVLAAASGARLVRAHDVRSTVLALRVAGAICGARRR